MQMEQNERMCTSKIGNFHTENSNEKYFLEIFINKEMIQAEFTAATITFTATQLSSEKLFPYKAKYVSGRFYYP